MNAFSGRFASLGLLCALLLSACGQSQQGPEAVELAVPGNCDAAKTECQAAGDGVSVSLALGPGVKVLETFPIRLEIEGAETDPVSGVKVTFNMRDMDMGVNRYKLQDLGSQWVGKGMLPVCVTGRSDWIAEVEITTGSRLYRAVFAFQTGS